MSSRVGNQYGALRWAAALAVAGLLVLAAGPSARAQSVESGSHDSLEGTWRAQVSVVDCATGTPFPGRPIPELLAFVRGGTVSGATDESLAFKPGQLTSEYGIWKSSGGNTYWSVREALITFTTTANPPMRGFSEGTQRFTEKIHLDDDRYTGMAVTQFLDVAGKVVFTGCTRSTGKRFR
jgi:hypothetical protein